MRVPLLSLIVLSAAVATARADEAKLPANLPTLAGAKLVMHEHHRFDYLEVGYFEAGDKNIHHDKVEGERFAVNLEPGGKSFDHDAWAAAAKQAGFTVLTPSGAVVARRIDGGVKTWLLATTPYDYHVVIEHAPPAVTVAAPAKEPETLTPDTDLPYFAPTPTMKRTEWHEDDGQALTVDQGGGARLVVGPPVLVIRYKDPDASGIEVQREYTAALERVGWVVTSTSYSGVTTLHYTKDGRDIWLAFSDGNMWIRMVDVGAAAAAAKLEAELTAHGHVALYGIYFDNDKSTLRPESEATLLQIQRLLALEPKLKLEIQGHTDSSGAHDHNQELSDARAAAVKQWLVDHKVDGARLVTKGYAETVPVADNKTEQGRAKNRRVELATVK
jgi:hypothetical protein